MKKLWIVLIVILLCGGCECKSAEVENEKEIIDEEFSQVGTLSLGKKISPILDASIEYVPMDTISEFSGIFIGQPWSQIPEKNIASYLIPNHEGSVKSFDDNFVSQTDIVIMAFPFSAENIEPLYNMFDQLPVENITRIFESPNHELWAIENRKILLRYDGNQWVNESNFFERPEKEDIKKWISYSEEIGGFDFDNSGNVWILDYQVEIYGFIDNEWIHITFPKGWLPSAGGGISFDAFSVNSENDITIFRDDGELGYPKFHYDGNDWQIERQSTPYPEHNTINSSDDGLFNYFVVNRNRYGRNDYSTNEELPQPLVKVSSVDHFIFTDRYEYIWVQNSENLFNFQHGAFTKTDGYSGRSSELMEAMNFETQIDDIFKYYIWPTKEDWISVKNRGAWQEFVIYENDHDSYAVRLEDGRMISASATEISIIDHGAIQMIKIVPSCIQNDLKTYIETCKDYTSASTFTFIPQCSLYADGKSSDEFKIKYLGVLQNDSIFYANNRAIVNIIGNDVRYYFTEDFDIESVAMDTNGNIWILTNQNKIFQVSLDIFMDYPGPVLEETE